jgi:hypothetical protein
MFEKMLSRSKEEPVLLDLIGRFFGWAGHMKESRWRWVCFSCSLPLVVGFAAADISANFRTEISRVSAEQIWIWRVGLIWIYAATVLCVLVLGICLLRYLNKYVFSSPKEHAARVLKSAGVEGNIDELPLVENNIPEPQLNSVLEKALHSKNLGAEACKRIAFLAGIGFSLAAVFTLANSSVILLDYAAGRSRALLHGFIYGGPGLYGFWRLIERCFYGNVVTLATVGYGDIYPAIAQMRVLVDAEIVSAFVLFALGINTVTALVMDSSGWAWDSRRNYLKAHIHATVNQKKAVLRLQPASEKPERANTLQEGANAR